MNIYIQASAWSAAAKIGGAHYDTVTFTSATDHAQEPIFGRSFELRAIGFNNDYTANFRLACYDVWGTPGAAPLDECAQVQDSCAVTWRNYQGCTVNGASIPSPECVSPLNSWCNCPDTY